MTIIGLPWALARFTLGSPQVDPSARALHRLLAGLPGAPAVAPAALARAAHRGEVAVMTLALRPELAPHLGAIAARHRRFDALLELALAEIAPSLLATAPLALAKGSAAAAWVYPESAWRLRKDLDIVCGEALPALRRTLLAAGWRDHTDPRASQDPATARAWPMARELAGSTLSLDLHRRLVHSRWCRPDVAALIAQSVPGRAALPVTAPADTFVHTALHLIGSGFHEPLKGWIDLLRLLPLLDPAALAERARLHRARTATWAALGVLSRWFSRDVTESRRALGAPPHGPLIDHLLAGEHVTPERRTLPRGAAYRLWRTLARDLTR